MITEPSLLDAGQQIQTDVLLIDDSASDLRVLMARDRAMENWLSQSVGSAYDALKSSPARAVPMAKVRARLAAEHKKSAAKA